MFADTPLIWLWAKLGANEYEDEFHPLVCHLIDVGCVAEELVCHRLPATLRPWLARGLGLAESAVGPWVAFWIAAHDIGKATPGFQLQGKTSLLAAKLSALGFHGAADKAPPHGFASAAILKKWCTRRGFKDRLALRIAYAVGGHHGIFPGPDLPASGHALGEGPWTAVQTELLDFLAERFVVPAEVPTGGTDDDQSVLLFLAGLTTVADWIGSNRKWFEWNVKPSDYLDHARRQARLALAEVKWPEVSGEPTGPAAFAKVFPKFSPRPLQTACETVAQSLAGPALILVEAPMGEGKTEGALYVADWWRRRTGGGVYVALPTMATSNGMFGRVRDFLAASVPEWAELHLLHGQAVLSDTYQELKQLAKVYDEGDTSGVAAHGWFAAQKKQAILAPYGVGTIDQALLSVLQTKHFFLRLFGLAGKTVILDEVHAYDTYMSTLMNLLLKWLAALGCPVVLLSATLPKARRLELLRAYAGDTAAEPEHVAYPRVTWVARGGKIECQHVEADKSRDRVIRVERIADASLAEKLTSALAKGGCACVIRNTVGLAQETYLGLKQALAGAGIELMLFHARFRFGRRQDIEAEVLKRFGKDGPRPHKAILVATQVVEQSLDLDFDLMATDVAPVDLVLQRSGRLHRHGGRTRATAVADPRLLLIEPSEKDGRPDFGKSEYVYERYVLLRSWELLWQKEQLRVPQEIEGLVETVYREQDETDVDFSEAKESARSRRQEKQALAKAVLAPAPAMKRNFWACWNAALGEDDDPTTAESRRAATRDVEPTVQLIVAYVKNGREFLEISCHEPMTVDQELTSANLDHVKAILKNAVTASNRGCFYHYAFRDPPKAWAKNGLLKYHRLVRVNPDGTSLSDEHPMTVDDEIGVRFTRNTLEK